MLNAALDRTLDSAIDRGIDFLLAQAEADFAEARHEMTFPHAAGFSGACERQSTDVFARAVLSGVICDILDVEGGDGRSRELRRVARREAAYVAGRKLAHCEGGWSYFPDLPELPPDADSLAAALSLFARIAPAHVELCRRSVDMVLEGARPDGSFETWIMPPDDGSSLRTHMERGVRYYWGSGTDIDVVAHFYHALLLADPIRYAAAIQRGAATIASAQGPDGAWQSTWYVGPAYGTSLCLQLLRDADLGAEAAAKAHAALRETQRDDGTWGLERPLPLETAVSMWALRWSRDAGVRAAVARAADALVQMQESDGSWELSPWICMPIGRATGQVRRLATYQSVTITSAFCLRSLVAAREWAEPPA